MSRTGLTEEVTWHIDGLVALFEFIDNLQFDKDGHLREGHHVHVKVGSKSYTIRVGAGCSQDTVLDCFAAALPASFPGRKPARSIETTGDAPQTGQAAPPWIGEAIVCLIAPTNRQQERLGDFQEKWETIWLPKFGQRLSRWIYVAHAVRSGGAVFWLTAASIAGDLWARLTGWHW